MCDCDKPYRRIHQVNSELVNTKNALILSQNNESLQTANVDKPFIRIHYLSQKDTENGTIRIREPGYYVLSEDLIFHPNPSNSFKPTSEQTIGGADAVYPLAPHGAYNLGFFAGITIESDDVAIDLNGFKIEQSPEFNLLQRFYAHIELASSPFIPKQGPSNFGDSIKVPTNVMIKNGTLGKSSHHGIHGNSMTNVTIEDVTFENFEVAAIALNGGKNICIKDCIIKQMNTNIKTLSLFSQSLFTLPHLKRIESRDSTLSLNLNSESKTITTIIEELEREVELAKNYALNDLPYNGILKNHSGLYDGNAYGIVLTSRGVVIGDFKPMRPDDMEGNQDITIQNVSINNIITDGVEIIGINCDENTNDADEVKAYGKDQFVGPVGDVLDYDLITDLDGKYKPNVYTNAQLIISKHGIDKSEKGTANISEEIINWAESDSSIYGMIRENRDDPMEDGKCNYKIVGRDSMGHVMKGNIGLFISQGKNIRANNIKINNIVNKGTSENIASDSAGILITGSRDVSINNKEIKKIFSNKGVSKDVDMKTTNFNILIG